MPPKTQLKKQENITAEAPSKTSAILDILPEGAKDVPSQLEEAAQKGEEVLSEENQTEQTTEEQEGQAQQGLVEEQKEKTQQETEELGEAIQETTESDIVPETETPAKINSENESKNIAINEALSQKRKTTFAMAVQKGKKLPDSSSGVSKTQGALTAAEALQSGFEESTKSEKEKTDEPEEGKTEEEKTAAKNQKSDIQKIGNILPSVLLGAVLIKNIMNTKKSRGMGMAFAENVPAVLKFLSNLTKTVVEQFYSEKSVSKTILNALIPCETFFTIIQSVIERYKAGTLLEKLTKYTQKHEEQKTDFEPVMKDIETKQQAFIPRIITLVIQNISEIGYAVLYAKNPTSFGTSFFKVLSSGSSVASKALENKSASEKTEADEGHSALAEKRYNAFTELYTNPDYYIGANENKSSGTEAQQQTDSTIDEASPIPLKETAIAQYEDVQESLEAVDVTPLALFNCESKEEQKKTIANAIGF